MTGRLAPSGGRQLLAVGLCLLLLGAGVLLSVQATPPPRPSGVSGLVLAAVLAVLTAVYYAAHRISLDLELRGDSHSVTLVQLPLALGVLFVAPLAHLGVRVAAACLLALRPRQNLLKVLYNVAAAAFELGAAAFAVAQVPHGETGPQLWGALYLGLLTGDVVGSLVLSAVWKLLGMPVSTSDAVRLLGIVAPVTLVFTGLSIVALAAVHEQPATAVVILALGGALALAYRAHRRILGQQEANERLHAFVKDLGPLDVDSPDAARALERMRLLLHAHRLDLALRRDDTWCRLVAEEGSAPTTVADPADVRLRPPVSGPVLSSGQNGADTMSTPLVAGTELTGVLRASGRLGTVRGFDMADLRLLETVGAELATALDRGRLLTDLERSATTDALTGLPNLAETTRRLDRLLAAPDDRPSDVVLAVLTVQAFRDVNTTLGRDVGDQLLLEVARRLRAVTPGGIVGRIGGNRFAVAVAVPGEPPGADPELFGLSLRAQGEGPVHIGAISADVRLCVGVVQAPEHGSAAATLLRRAETALSGARQAGGGPVLWAPAYEVAGTRRLAVVMALREALTNGAIAVVYQPKVATSGVSVTGVEALARWTHPALGAIGPGEFVPLAEAAGLMGPLTATVLRQSLLACREWQARAPEVGVSVNVSADTVLDAAFVTQVAALLDSIGVPPQLLTLELTESVLLEDPALAVERMRELRTLGVGLSVDDFGTGYSSLTYLRGLPVGEVKIDKGFVDGLSSDAADRAVVRAVVDIAHTLGLHVVAEGVEQEDQQAILQALGVDQAQGFLHARPMTAHEFVRWLRDRAPRSGR